MGDNQDFPGIYTSDGQVVTYTQPAESLGAISTMPYTPVVPASSSCTTFASADLYKEAISLFGTSSATAGASTGAPAASATGSGKASGSSGSATRSGSSAAASGSDSASSARIVRMGWGENGAASGIMIGFVGMLMAGAALL